MDFFVYYKYINNSKMADKTYSVYVHKVETDDGPMYYTGVTAKLKVRWRSKAYKKTSLNPYIDKYGWENIDHAVVFETCDYQMSRKIEGQLILFYSSIGKRINHHRSGLVFSDGKTAWQLDKMHNDPDYAERQRQSMRKYQRKKLATPEGKIYNRVKAYNKCHPDRAIETPLEARQKYIESGYIPDYIKHNDL